jgi:serine/threonine-protein phosphatase 5
VERFKNQKTIHKRYVARLLIACIHYLESIPSLMEISIPLQGPNADTPPRVSVCGDTHGQFYDVLNIFDLNGFPSSHNPYIFNGDFVDRGSFSVEVILTIIMWKISCPDSIYVTRGNHETKNMSTRFMDSR